MTKTVYQICQSETGICGKVAKDLHFPHIGELNDGMSTSESDLLTEIQEEYQVLASFDKAEYAVEKLRKYQNSAVKRKNGGVYYWWVEFYWVQQVEMEYDEICEEWEITEILGQWFAKWEPEESE